MRRPERVAESVREEIVQIVGYELDDPRLTSITVTDVRMSENLRDARVFVTVLGTEAEAHEALVALRHAAPYVRRQLGFALNLRHAPEIHFVRDTVEEKAERVDELLRTLAHKDANSPGVAESTESTERTEQRDEG